MSRRLQASNARRVKAATSRLESQPYDFLPNRRTPRLGGASQILYCQFASTVGAATGTWPNLTPGSATGVTLYRSVNGALVAIPGTWTVYNYYKTAFNAAKTTEVSACGDGTFQTVNQDC